MEGLVIVLLCHDATVTVIA